MPYTQSQVRYLTGMGIVPWIERAHASAAELLPEVHAEVHAEVEHAVVDKAQQMAATQVALAAEPAAVVKANKQSADHSEPGLAFPANLMQTPLVEIPFRGQYCSQLGTASAPLLILVEAVSHQQKQYPFEPTDAKLFDDMLRAIAWRRQDVCLAVLPPDQQTDLAPAVDGPRVADLCKPHRDAVLLFRQSMPETLNADELIIPMERASMLAWQLPHPALLRESPTRKRQAWNVLKAARERLK